VLDDCVVDVDLEVLDDVFVVVVCVFDDGVVVDANVVDSGWPLTILLTVTATLMPKAYCRRASQKIYLALQYL